MAFAYTSCVEPAVPESVTAAFVPAAPVPVLPLRDTVVEQVNEPAVQTPETPVSRTETVVFFYTREIGVREASGHNDGSRVEDYLASCGRQKGDAWCAAFVTWVFKQAGVEAAVSAWSPAWFPEKNTVYARGRANNIMPQRADVFGIYFSAQGRIAHVGFVDRWEEGENSFTLTVEGNTNDAGSREGDGVYRKRRLKSQIYKVSRWVNDY